jgi:hypothetical protein
VALALGNVNLVFLVQGLEQIGQVSPVVSLLPSSKTPCGLSEKLISSSALRCKTGCR